MTAGWAVRYGDGAVEHLPAAVAAAGFRRVLLVCGRRSFEASGAAVMLPELRQVAEVHRWSDFAPNTDAADLRHGLQIIEEFGPDLVLGVGGGSAMDMAKLLTAYQGLSGEFALHAAIRSGERVTARRLGLMLVPTTSGSGSEATHFAVVYIGDEKYSVAGQVLRPDLTVLDPALTLSGSPYQRATSGIDAVAQAIESLWAVSATDASRRWARHGLALLLPAIAPFVAAPSAESARAMAIGSHLAGRAIDTSRTTAAHALSYGITKRYGVSHGHAVALTLGGFLKAHDRPDPARLNADPDSHAAAMAEIRGLLGVPDGVAARAWLLGLLDELGLAARLADVGVESTDELRELAKSVNVERLGNNPLAFDEDSLVDLLAEARAGAAA